MAVVGSTVRARNLCDATFQSSVSDAQLKLGISEGKGVMRAYGDEYNEEQMNALVRHIRSLKPPTTP
jgi:cytochrome c553